MPVITFSRCSVFYLERSGADHSFGKKGDTGMLNMIREKIGVRITLQVSLVMLLLMAGGPSLS